MPPVPSSTQTCLITGGAGFIGSHLAETLLAAGHTVRVLDNLSTGSQENISPLMRHPQFEFACAPVEDEAALERVANGCQVIFHLAAAVGVKLIVERPVHTIETNIRGTQLVLETAVRHGCRVIVASSSEVYGKGAKVPFAEDDDVLLGPTSKSRWAYAASKMVDEFLALAFAAECRVDVVCARLFNTIGPRQSGQYGMVVPRLVRQALRGEPLTVYGDGGQTRCFCDVRDVVRALLGLAAQRNFQERVFNVGSTEEMSIQKLAEKILQLTGSSSPIRRVPFHEAYAPGFEDMQRRVPDLTRIKQLLGWQVVHSLDDTLPAIIRHERQQVRSSP